MSKYTHPLFLCPVLDVKCFVNVFEKLCSGLLFLPADCGCWAYVVYLLESLNLLLQLFDLRALSVVCDR